MKDMRLLPCAAWLCRDGDARLLSKGQLSKRNRVLTLIAGRCS